MSPQRIDLWCPPFRGHLHPMIAMARALSESAFDVRILSTDKAQAEIADSAVKGEAILPGFDDLIDRIANPPRPIRSNPLALIRQLRQTLGLLTRLRTEVQRVYAHGNAPALVIVDSVLPTVGLTVAEQGLTWWTSTPSPCAIEPKRGAPGYLGGWDHREDGWGRIRDRCGNAFVRLFKRTVHRLHRRRLTAMGLPRMYRSNGDEAIYSPLRILGLGLPELEFPRQWPDAFRWIGPLLYTPPSRAQGSTPVFDEGKRHVFVTLGTHVPWIKSSVASTVEAFSSRFPDVVFHFSDGDPEAIRRPNSSSFRRYPYLPYEPHLSRFDLVVHHGGTGIMYQCIRAGLPCVALPVDYDHFDHAARIARAGIGLRVRGVSELEDAVRTALGSGTLRQRSRVFQTHLQTFDPASRLRSEVEGCLAEKACRPAV